MKIDKCFVVPARSGSKGVPQKNTKLIHGSMLFEWSIFSALEVIDKYDRIYISTNCELIFDWFDKKISNHPSEYISEKINIIKRPEYLCLDNSSTESALVHLYNELLIKGIETDTFVLLQPTSPFRTENIIKKCLKKYYEYSGIYSVFSSNKLSNFNWKVDENGMGRPIYDFTNRKMRQDLDKNEFQWHEDGNVYIFSSQQLLKYNNRMSEISIPVENNILNSFQIDSNEDFELCEAICNIEKVNLWLEKIRF